MSKENVETLRRHYDAFNRGDLDGVMEPVDPEIEFEMEADAGPFAAKYRGHDEVRKFYEGLWEVVEGLRAEPEEFIEVGEDIIVSVRFSGRFRYTGISTESNIPTRVAHVYTVCGGRIVRLHVFRDVTAAYEAVRSRA